MSPSLRQINWLSSLVLLAAAGCSGSPTQDAGSAPVSVTATPSATSSSAVSAAGSTSNGAPASVMPVGTQSPEMAARSRQAIAEINADKTLTPAQKAQRIKGLSLGLPGGPP